MSTLRKLKAAAAKVGATVEKGTYGMTICVEVFAPQGKVFAEGGGTHIMVDDTYVGFKPDYDDLLSRLSYGLEDCEDPDCEWCYPDDEEEVM